MKVKTEKTIARSTRERAMFDPARQMSVNAAVSSAINSYILKDEPGTVHRITANAEALETASYLTLFSYDMPIALLDKRTDSIYIYIGMFEKSKPVAWRQVRKFEQKYSKNGMNCERRYIWKKSP